MLQQGGPGWVSRHLQCPAPPLQILLVLTALLVVAAFVGLDVQWAEEWRSAYVSLQVRAERGRGPGPGPIQQAGGRGQWVPELGPGAAKLMPPRLLPCILLLCRTGPCLLLFPTPPKPMSWGRWRGDRSSHAGSVQQDGPGLHCGQLSDAGILLQATGPFLHIGAVAGMTLLAWPVASTFYCSSSAGTFGGRPQPSARTPCHALWGGCLGPEPGGAKCVPRGMFVGGGGIPAWHPDRGWSHSSVPHRPGWAVAPFWPAPGELAFRGTGCCLEASLCLVPHPRMRTGSPWK